MKKKLVTILLLSALSAVSLAGCGQEKPEPASKEESSRKDDSGKTAEELLTEKYDKPVDVHVVLQYRESENPNTPKDVTPETSTAVKKLKEDLNINLIYDWIVNADQFQQKFGAELAAGNLPDVMMISPNDFEDLTSQGGLADLSDVYKKYSCEELDKVYNYDGKFIDVGKKDGKLYGLPMGTDPAQMTSQMLYNMTQLKTVGITSKDQLPKTIDEFEELCDKLQKTDYDGDGKTGGPVLPACKNYVDAQLADFSPFFHAYDIWAADSPVVNDIVAGKYAIVPGSWWVPNWPLNSNKTEHPDADWVIGPNLSPDGKQPKIMIDRYPVNNFVVAGRDFKHPEAIFKMMYWSLQYESKNTNPEVQEKMTDEQKKELDSYVYTWLPYRVYYPTSLRDNYKKINELVDAGKTSITSKEGLENNEFWGAWSQYLNYKKNPDDGAAWGTYFSRLDPDGGVANMIKTVESADTIYDEVYISTPAMVSKKAELDKLRDNTFISMIMGESSVSEFDKYVKQWKAQGGDEISKEVNNWYKEQKK